MHRSPFGLRTPKDLNASAGTYFVAPSACLAFTGHRAQKRFSTKRKAHMTTPSLLIREARPSMSSSSWPESSRKSPSLGNTACTTWAPTPRERAPFEKGKTAACNHSPANKTPKPTLSRTCPPKSVPRAQEKMGTAHQAHQARSSDRPSPVRLRRHLSRHRLHHRAKGDSET